MKKIFLQSFFVFLLFFGVAHALCAKALSVSPARQTTVIDPGKSEHILLSVKNDQHEPITVKGSIEGFQIDEKTYRAFFGAREEAVKWGKVNAHEISLAPGETKEIEYVFTVPRDASPGAHYLALFAEIKAGEGQVGISTRVGSLLFLYVAGDVKESMNVLDFSSGSRWYSHGNAEIFLKTENQGTIHVFPTGKITVRNFRGGVIQTFDVNPENHLVIPQNQWSRIFDVQFSPRDIGKINATLEFTYGVNQKMILRKISFWYVPWWAVGVIVGIFILFMIGVIKKGFFSRVSKDGQS